MEKQFLVYRTTNNLNNKIYVGIHETFNINDSYIGSGHRFLKAVKKYGKENFTKEILFIFDNKQEMLDKEKEIVDKDFIKDLNNYNTIIGGGFHTGGFANVKDSNGNKFLIDVDDPRYLSGEFVGITKGMVNVKDPDGNTSQVTMTEFKNNDSLESVNSKMATLRDKDGKVISVSIDDPRYLSGELIGACKDLVPVRDKDDNYLVLHRDSDEYKSGEYKAFFEGRKHSKETIEKMKESKRNFGIGKSNPQYGKKWINSLKEKRSIIVSENDIGKYLENGWVLGRKMSF